MIPRIPLPAQKWLRLGFVVTAIISAESNLRAQFSVAPSQTSSFYNDLRQRSTKPQGAAVDESATGSYDFSRGEYTGESTSRPMGEPVDAADASNSAALLGADGSTRSGSVGNTKRNAGDYTGNGSPYPASSNFFAPTYVSDPFLQGKRNVKIGPVNIGVGLSTNVEYNDNITSSNKDRLDDYIAGTYLNLSANYPITRNNSLNLSAVVGIDHYFNHPEKSANGKDFVFDVAPGTSISFDMKVGDILFVFYDRVSVRPASQSSFTLDNLNIFGVFQNDGGMAANWAINSTLNFSLNYNRSDARALTDTYSVYDRSIDSLSASLAWKPTGTYTVGIESSYSMINYLKNFNNDGTTFNIGAFLILPITHSTVVKLAGGYQSFAFDSPPPVKMTVSDADITSLTNQVNSLDAQIEQSLRIADPAQAALTYNALLNSRQTAYAALTNAQTIKVAQDAQLSAHTYDSADLGDYYYNVSLFNQFNSRVSQTLSFGHESSLNTSSNFITADYISYGVGIIAWRGAKFTMSGYYEKANASGGRLAEDTKQYGFDAFLTHRLTDRMTAGLGYHYGNTDSNLVLRDYSQNAYTVDLTYSVNQKMTLGFGYRYYTTTAENHDLDFDQNRIIMTMNYNF